MNINIKTNNINQAKLVKKLLKKMNSDYSHIDKYILYTESKEVYNGERFK